MNNSKKVFISALAASLAGGSIVAVQPAQASENGAKVFSDVKPGDLYYDAVLSLSKSKIITGYSDGTYRPYEKLNRGQAAVLLTRALGLDKTQVKNPGFKDVKVGSTYYNEVAALAQFNIIEGYPDKTFKPEQPISRAQMAKIIAIGYKLQEEDLVDNPFKDVNAKDWYATYIPALIKNKITVGKTPTTFSPYDTVSRGQMALFIHRSEQMKRVIESKVMNITADSILLGDKTYKLNAEQKKWLNVSNLNALKGAVLKATVIGDELVAVQSIQLNANGKASENGAEYKNHVVLNGGGTALDTNIIINGDYVSLENLIIKGNLEITSNVKNSLYTNKLKVDGKITTKDSGVVSAAFDSLASTSDKQVEKAPTVIFNNSTIQALESAINGFHFKFAGSTSIRQITLSANAKIEGEKGISLESVTLASGALQVSIDAEVLLLQLQEAKGKLTLGNNAKVNNITIPKDSDIKAIIQNYEQVKNLITKIDGENNPDTSTPSTGGGSGGGTPEQK
ncbi:S-layer homology domain-containing protein [Peribacillus loiseleuriae]|uniref:S-layer homology domain-containing protein n=1 Tax=Peribacillus loiseleuriae TaxID=1679170 RepID=UPI003D07D6E7